MVSGSVFVLFVVAAANLCIASSADPLYTTGSECNTVRFRAGCFLDVLEKACESKKDLMRCQHNPKSCAEQEEFPGTALPLWYCLTAVSSWLSALPHLAVIRSVSLLAEK